MHELSIAHAVVDAVATAAAAHGARRVTAVTLRVGALSGVVPEALAFCFDIAAADTVVAGAALAIERVAIVVHCPACVADRTIPQEDGRTLVLRCPACAALCGDVRAGRELDVVSFAIEDDDDAPVDDDVRPAPTATPHAAPAIA